MQIRRIRALMLDTHKEILGLLDRATGDWKHAVDYCEPEHVTHARVRAIADARALLSEMLTYASDLGSACDNEREREKQEENDETEGRPT